MGCSDQEAQVSETGHPDNRSSVQARYSDFRPLVVEHDRTKFVHALFDLSACSLISGSVMSILTPAPKVRA